MRGGTYFQGDIHHNSIDWPPGVRYERRWLSLDAGPGQEREADRLEEAMPIINERDRREVQAQLKVLTGPVKLVNFTQELACQYCRETEQLLGEVKELSDKISLEVYNFQLDKEKVAQYRVDKIPATVVEGSKDYGIR
jgi:thiol-disulfide isomerase/thioredoxin